MCSTECYSSYMLLYVFACIRSKFCCLPCVVRPAENAELQNSGPSNSARKTTGPGVSCPDGFLSRHVISPALLSGLPFSIPVFPLPLYPHKASRMRRVHPRSQPAPIISSPSMRQRGLEVGGAVICYRPHGNTAKIYRYGCIAKFPLPCQSVAQTDLYQHCPSVQSIVRLRSNQGQWTSGPWPYVPLR